ncbi:hypothetical protein COLO4_35298 [Corchorus olitorius]|uniref:Uncharacterized protein n=1 Tax=Corchorus olitorius TaxID=93759 RepID=A0A1R3GHJ8_9ROSI|nr:hypothetical protein COLO4_35298 [Corchorus olitorius]
MIFKVVIGVIAFVEALDHLERIAATIGLLWLMKFSLLKPPNFAAQWNLEWNTSSCDFARHGWIKENDVKSWQILFPIVVGKFENFFKNDSVAR